MAPFVLVQINCSHLHTELPNAEKCSRYQTKTFQKDGEEKKEKKAKQKKEKKRRKKEKKHDEKEKHKGTKKHKKQKSAGNGEHKHSSKKKQMLQLTLVATPSMPALGPPPEETNATQM